MSDGKMKKADWRRQIRPAVLEMSGYGVEEPSGLVKLDANENPYPPPEWLREILGEAARKLDLNRYPDPGAAALRRLLAKRLDWPVEGIMLGNGSDELIGTLLTACGHDGAVMLVPSPTFAMYRIIGLASGWEVVEEPLNGYFDLDEESILRQVRRRSPRLVVFAYPNNPSGNCYTRQTIRKVLAEAPGLVLVDEAYFDFSRRTFLPLLAEYPNLVILRTLSKIGLAALRVGMLAANPALVAELDKVRLPYNVGSFSQAAALLILENGAFLDEEIERLIGERSRLYEGIGRVEGCTPFPSEANFVLFRSRRDSAGTFERLREEGVLVRDLGRPGILHNCLRVTVGTPEENSRFLEALAAVAGISD